MDSQNSPVNTGQNSSNEERHSLKNLLALQQIKGLGPSKLSQLLEYFGSSTAILQACESSLAPLGQSKSGQALQQAILQ